jgi:hypothetical protein
MPVIPDDEFTARLDQFIRDHGGSQGSGLCGHWAHYVMMERKFRQETGNEPAPGPASTARPSSFKSFIRKQERPQRRS